MAYEVKTNIPILALKTVPSRFQQRQLKYNMAYEMKTNNHIISILHIIPILALKVPNRFQQRQHYEE